MDLVPEASGVEPALTAATDLGEPGPGVGLAASGVELVGCQPDAVKIQGIEAVIHDDFDGFRPKAAPTHRRFADHDPHVRLLN